jgi:hypothetical protein
MPMIGYRGREGCWCVHLLNISASIRTSEHL